jgi:hypothetical protein
MKYRQRKKKDGSNNWSDWNEIQDYKGDDTSVTIVCKGKHEDKGVSTPQYFTILRKWIVSAEGKEGGAIIETTYHTIEIAMDHGDTSESTKRIVDFVKAGGQSNMETSGNTQSNYPQREETQAETGNQEGTSSSGPFGLTMGMTKDDFKETLEELAPYKYRLIEIPRKHSKFDDYIGQISPVSGLSWIKAISATIHTSAYGHELKNAFLEMREKLARVYGNSELCDQLSYDSIWNEPRDWMQGLLSRERYLFADWSQKSINGRLPNDLENIYLSATALDSASGFISIEYYFVNHEQAAKEIDLMEDDAL